MTAYMVPEVWCDTCFERAVAESQESIRELRAALRAAGWTRPRITPTSGAPTYEDRCPKCSEVAANG